MGRWTDRWVHTVALTALGFGGGCADEAEADVAVVVASPTGSIAAGGESICAVRRDGALYCWGRNLGGEFGDVTGNSSSPVRIGNDSTWSAVAVGERHRCALRRDGSLWCWGWQSEGQLGDGTLTTRTVPTRVGAWSDWRAIAAGGDNTCGIRRDGSLWCWGSILRAREETGVRTAHLLPERVGGETKWTHVSVGSYTACGVQRDGSLWCTRPVAWDPSAARLSLTRIGSGSDWVRASSSDGSMACALRRDGTLWCQRGLSSGQLPTTLEQLWPETRWSGVLGGQDPTFATQPDGSLWSLNPITGFGESPILTPQRIDLPRACAAVTGEGGFWCALDDDSAVWCFGHNDYGLGTGATTAAVITRVTGPLGQPLTD